MPRVSLLVVLLAVAPGALLAGDDGLSCRQDRDCVLLPDICPACPPCRPAFRMVGNRTVARHRERIRATVDCAPADCPSCSSPANWLPSRPVCRAGLCRPAGRGITHLYTDLDGTALREGGGISPRVLKQVRRFRRAGGHLGVATGRLPDRALEQARRLGADLPLVFGNGAVITTPDGKLIRMQVIDNRRDVQTMCALISRSAWGNPGSGDLQVEMGACRPADKPGYGVVRIRARRCRFHKRLLRSLPRLVGNRCSVVTSGKGRHLGISIAAAGVDKAEALRFVAHRLGIDLSRLAYVGDSGNDVTALELVDRAGGLCFSMKNATASALRACPRRTGTDNEHGGAAEVLQLLQPQAAPSGQ